MNSKMLCELCYNEVEPKDAVRFYDSKDRMHYICFDCALNLCEHHHDILAQVNDIANIKIGDFTLKDLTRTCVGPSIFKKEDK